MRISNHKVMIHPMAFDGTLVIRRDCLFKNSNYKREVNPQLKAIHKLHTAAS